MPGTAGGGELPPTRTITVYKNGDAFFSGRKIVVNPRHLSTFDNFLTFLTRGIEAPFGAVRRLYTPREGHKVDHLDDLKHGSVYVAAGNEQFKKLDYCEITTKKPQKKKNEQIRPVVHSRIVVSARWKRITDESCTINVFTNGEVLAAPARIRIPKYTLRSWENVLAMVTERVRLRTGAVFRQDILPAIRKTRHPKDVFARTGFREDLEHTARGQMKKQAKLERTKQQRQVSRNPVLFSTGEGSVFNAQNKRSEMAGAAEVQEDRQVKVDLPIDQVEAKIVDEEYENGSCSASPCKASIHDSHNLHLQRSLSAGSRNDETKEREASSRHRGIRSRVSRFFKEKMKPEHSLL
ncbi:doublecortin domain-containing protein 2 isoform X4 [Etheostoma spectabile]|uniref:doublecortin domain-containing protein 2 isoform X4 n=1 Tax=Etheostoma spectabile TaxID=54343 RepID=UPI0013AEC503|nr:doublecortin domain-containing protein 2C isoform X4 [Etheostoma spectabile]